MNSKMEELTKFGFGLIPTIDHIDIEFKMKAEASNLGISKQEFRKAFDEVLLRIESQTEEIMYLYYPGRDSKFRPECITKLLESEGYNFVYTLKPDHFHIYDKQLGIWIDDGHKLDECHRLRKLGRDIYRKYAVSKDGYGGKEPRNGFINEFLIHVRDTTYVKHNEFFQPFKDKIPVENGILDPKTRELRPYTPEDRIKAKLNVKYDPKAKCPAIEAFLDDLISRGIITREDIDCILEYYGYALTFDNRFERYLMLIGKQGSGKSVLMELLAEILGTNFMSAETLQNLETDMFAPANLEGKILNLCADLPSAGLDEVPVLKKLVSGDSIQVRRLYEPAYTIKPECKLMFSANTPPIIKTDMSAFVRRLLLIHFKGNIPKEERDERLKEKVKTPEELSGFLNLLLDARKRLYKNRRFTNDRPDKEVEEMYKTLSNPYHEFAAECIISAPGKYVIKDEAWNLYKEWCDKHHVPYKEDKSVEFKKTLKTKFDGVYDTARLTISGKKTYVWKDAMLVPKSVMLKHK